MTGYGHGRAEDAEFAAAFSLKTTNHRFFDLQLRLPPEIGFFEPHARRLLRERIVRGHLEAAGSFERAGGVALRINRKTLTSYIAALQVVREEFGAGSELDLVALLRIPGIIESEADLPAKEAGRLQGILEKALLGAVGSLNATREAEGRALARDLEARLAKVGELAALADGLSRSAQAAFAERLAKRVQELASPAAVDPARLAQEVTILAVRSDVTEEITRLRSHVEQATELIGGQSEVGKKLDFLLQEMNREANTLLAKTTDIPGPGLRIAESAIEMKVEIEKIREQAQNIE